MNAEQKKVLVIGLIVAALVIMYPPFLDTSLIPGMGQMRYNTVFYDFIWSHSGDIAVGRLLLQMVVVALVTVALIVTR